MSNTTSTYMHHTSALTLHAHFKTWTFHSIKPLQPFVALRPSLNNYYPSHHGLELHPTALLNGYSYIVHSAHVRIALKQPIANKRANCCRIKNSTHHQTTSTQHMHVPYVVHSIIILMHVMRRTNQMLDVCYVVKLALIMWTCPCSQPQIYDVLMLSHLVLSLWGNGL